MPLACVCLTVQSTLMANSINQFMDDMHLNMSNSFTHLLDIESNEELNVIRHSPYSSDDELIESRMNFTTSMNILTLYCIGYQRIGQTYLFFASNVVLG